MENTSGFNGVPEVRGIVRLRSAGASLRSRWQFSSDVLRSGQ